MQDLQSDSSNTTTTIIPKSHPIIPLETPINPVSASFSSSSATTNNHQLPPTTPISKLQRHPWQCLEIPIPTLIPHPLTSGVLVMAIGGPTPRLASGCRRTWWLSRRPIRSMEAHPRLASRRSDRRMTYSPPTLTLISSAGTLRIRMKAVMVKARMVVVKERRVEVGQGIGIAAPSMVCRRRRVRLGRLWRQRKLCLLINLLSYGLLIPNVPKGTSFF